MDMMEFLRTRRTYRRFEQRPVAPEILQGMDAAHIASCGAKPPDGEVYHRAKPRCGRRAPLVHWPPICPGSGRPP